MENVNNFDIFFSTFYSSHLYIEEFFLLTNRMSQYLSKSLNLFVFELYKVGNREVVELGLNKVFSDNLWFRLGN